MISRPILDNIPYAPLKIIALDNCFELGEQINQLIVDARHKVTSQHKNTLAFLGYQAESYLLKYSFERYATGEAKANLHESVRGKDLFILCDVANHTIQYPINQRMNYSSPDDNFQNLKRIVEACSGRAKRIHIIMPYLYEGRQNMREKQESLDCAVALQELFSMGVSTVITFEAHEPRIQNSVPIDNYDDFHPSYQFVKTIKQDKEIAIDKDRTMVISPDLGGMKRAVFYANVLGLNMGMFYLRRNYTSSNNELIGIEFLGNDPKGMDTFLVDDMIATGKTILRAARELKKRGSGKVVIAATFGLFNNGLEEFDKAYEEGVFDKIYTTNLTYCSPELLSKPYYVMVDMSKYLALIIDTLNNDVSINEIQDSIPKIQELLGY